MKQPLNYLKPNVVLEPLIDRWYAWSHLIPPATYSMNILNRHLKIMNSYVQSPELHAQAVKNPRLLGGPFMDYERDRSKDVLQLMDSTLAKRGKQIELAKAIIDLDKFLLRECKGFSMEPLYAKIPPILRGYVELVYDLHNNPSFRLAEALLYRSEYYDDNSQSIALWLTNNDQRPFCLSTPRLDTDGMIHTQLPFRSETIDKLSILKRMPAPIEYIRDLLGLQNDSKQLNDLITTQEPTPYRKYTGEKVRMRYFGHACIFLETATFNILVDPLISYYGYQSDVSRFSDLDIPETLDYVLITHNHQDHILFETLLSLRHKIRNLVIPKTRAGQLQDPSLTLLFKAIGFRNVIEIDEMESIKFDDCEITGIPFIGEHSDLDIRSKICHHIRIQDFSLLFLADSCNIEPALYQHVQREIGDVDVVFLGMECDGAPLSWLYGPLINGKMDRDKDHSRCLSGSNFEQARSLVRIFSPKELYVYAMGQEPWTKFISTKEYTEDSVPIIESNKLLVECAANNITAQRLFGEKELFFDKELKLNLRRESSIIT